MKNLINNKTEESDVKFSGNIYPENALGRFLELADYNIPYIIKGIIHSRNIIKGR